MTKRLNSKHKKYQRLCCKLMLNSIFIVFHFVFTDLLICRPAIWPWALMMTSSNQELIFFTTSGSPPYLGHIKREFQTPFLEGISCLVAGFNIPPSTQSSVGVVVQLLFPKLSFSDPHNLCKPLNLSQEFRDSLQKPDGVNHLGGNSSEQPPPTCLVHLTHPKRSPRAHWAIAAPLESTTQGVSLSPL